MINKFLKPGVNSQKYPKMHLNVLTFWNNLTCSEMHSNALARAHIWVTSDILPHVQIKPVLMALTLPPMTATKVLKIPSKGSGVLSVQSNHQIFSSYIGLPRISARLLFFRCTSLKPVTLALFAELYDWWTCTRGWLIPIPVVPMFVFGDAFR